MLAGVVANAAGFIVAWQTYDNMSAASWVRWIVAVWLFGVIALAVAFAAHLYLTRAEIPGRFASSGTIVHIVWWGGMSLLIPAWPLALVAWVIFFSPLRQR